MVCVYMSKIFSMHKHNNNNYKWITAYLQGLNLFWSSLQMKVVSELVDENVATTLVSLTVIFLIASQDVTVPA